MAMSSLSPTTSSLPSLYQRPTITTNSQKTLVSFQGNLVSWSSSASYVKLKVRNGVVVKGLSQSQK
ncbi:hypothetical protein Tco_0434654, partial [Tanacetum coccineum]